MPVLTAYLLVNCTCIVFRMLDGYSWQWYSRWNTANDCYRCGHVYVILRRWSHVLCVWLGSTGGGWQTVLDSHYVRRSVLSGAKTRCYTSPAGSSLLRLVKCSWLLALFTTRNAWQSPAVACQAGCTHPGEDTPLQRSNRHICCLRDVICHEGVPFRAYWGYCECTARFLSLVTLTFDFWPWHSNSSEQRIKRVFCVNLAQIRSAVLPSVVECESQEGRRVADFGRFCA